MQNPSVTRSNQIVRKTQPEPVNKNKLKLKSRAAGPPILILNLS